MKSTKNHSGQVEEARFKFIASISNTPERIAACGSPVEALHLDQHPRPRMHTWLEANFVACEKYRYYICCRMKISLLYQSHFYSSLLDTTIKNRDQGSFSGRYKGYNLYLFFSSLSVFVHQKWHNERSIWEKLWNCENIVWYGLYDIIAQMHSS